MRRGLCTIVLLYAACTKPNPDYCDADKPCVDGRYCDLDGTVDGVKNACIDVSCAPGAFVTCAGDNELTCSSGGDNYNTSSCPHGCGPAGCYACAPSTDTCDGAELDHCDASGQPTASDTCLAGCVDGDTPHCARIAPKYAPDICDAPAANAALEVSSSGAMDTGLDSNCNGGVIAQTGGPDLCVVHYGSIVIDAGVTLHLTGKRSIALVADRDLTISGTVDASANTFTNGPGGGFLESGSSWTNVPMPQGGGGAGFATHGAAGGSTTADGAGGAAGAALSNPIALAVLEGGAQAGMMDGAFGGGGGGGVTFISCLGTVAVPGTIAAGGGGGPPGIFGFGISTPGGGGGAGGYIVLQGANVRFTGNIFANGGGGGAGCLTATALAGGDGPYSDDEAAYGGTSPDGGGAGGRGGMGQTQGPTVGRHPTTSGATPGGGGGSVGFLQTYTPAGVEPVLTPAHVSPPFQANQTAETR